MTTHGKSDESQQGQIKNWNMQWHVCQLQCTGYFDTLARNTTKFDSTINTAAADVYMDSRPNTISQIKGTNNVRNILMPYIIWRPNCYRILLVQVWLRTEVLPTPNSTRPGFELMTSRSWQYISCHWDACSKPLSHQWPPCHTWTSQSFHPQEIFQ